MQVAQDVDQKFTTATLPCNAAVPKVSPESVEKRASGAERTGMVRSMAKLAIANVAIATISFHAVLMRRAIFPVLLAAMVTWCPLAMAQADRITNQDAVAGLKAALEKGSQTAVAALGRTDGFLGNPKVKIPLPESLSRAETLMRRVGMGKYADELVVTMNRAAEAAVPEARQLLVDAVRKMTVSDAKAILTGGETSATDYFRRTTRDQLHGRFLPIVKRSTAKVGLAQRYNEYAQKGAALGLVKKDQADLDEYVTGRALEGVYLMVAEEEKKIRRDPVGAGSAIIRKVFGSLN
ncbi:MAG TPA: DUF4197 domain-containing protein [Burkholderiales bacterium]|nr:DUF4197 domain-containing protein [Burkholderiales bacterium]